MDNNNQNQNNNQDSAQQQPQYQNPGYSPQYQNNYPPQKVKKPIYKKWWFWVIIVIVLLAIIGSVSGGGSDTESSTDTTITTTDTLTTQPQSTTEEETEPDIPAEYKSALIKAQTYSDTMHMSKQGIYDQLTSEYGEQFSDEAAQYAVDNVDADWKENALKKQKHIRTVWQCLQKQYAIS